MCSLTAKAKLSMKEIRKQLGAVVLQWAQLLMELLEGGTTSLKTNKQTKNKTKQNNLHLSCSTRTTNATTMIAVQLLATHASVI